MLNTAILSLQSEKQKCRVGQEVKTPPFHGGITGSSPVRGTQKSLFYAGFFHINPRQCSLVKKYLFQLVPRTVQIFSTF